jgi:hypothetical protein
MTAAQKKKDINTYRNRAIIYSSSSAKQVFPLRAVRMDVERFKQEHRT